MAMLAERRRKVKWALNPRGKLWSDDSSKFGQKILEKMGWSSGKGLGVDGSGITEHVKVSYKNDSKGIGYKDRDDQWTQHEDHFNNLLSSLSGETNNEEEIAEPITTGFGFKEDEEKTILSAKGLSGESLEEKSKKSKARVHYKKFTRGKDISKYSEKDLANIFGKKAEQNSVEVNAPILNYGIVEGSKIEEKDKEEENKILKRGVTTIESKLSIAEYFKSKMPKIDSKSKYTVGPDGVLTSVNMKKQISAENNIASQNDEVSEDSTLLPDDVKKVMKKKQKFKDLECNTEEIIQDDDGPKKKKSKLVEISDMHETTSEHKKKSKKSSKKSKRQDENIQINSDTVDEQEMINNDSNAKKKKKRKNRDLQETENSKVKNHEDEEFIAESSTNSGIVNVEKQKNKYVEVDHEISLENNSERRVIKMKKQKTLIDSDENVFAKNELVNEIGHKTKRRKKKKLESYGIQENNDNENVENLEDNDNNINHKKKKQKKLKPDRLEPL